jgi:hypothetical protein
MQMDYEGYDILINIFCEIYRGQVGDVIALPNSGNLTCITLVLVLLTCLAGDLFLWCFSAR